MDLRANLKHLTKKFEDSEKVTRATPDPVAPAEGTTPIVIDVTDGQELTGRHHNTPAPVPSPLPNRKTVDPTGVLGTDIGYGPRSGPPVHPASDGTYTRPTGHFGSGLGGPTLPITPTVRPTPRDTTAENAHAAHMAGPVGCPHCLASMDPPPRPPQITPPVHDHNYDDGTHGRPSSPGLGSPILSPRAHQERVRGVNRFDIELLAHPLYHGRMDGVRALTVEFLANCGYNMIPSYDVVGSLNEIITAHRRITDSWYNASSQTSGPQIDRILLKSFKLFPQLETLGTEDVVNFYDRFHELSIPHLMALMPFNSIALKHGYEGLFIPGLGTRRYATCRRALIDFLPRLIPSTLSSRINATLTAVRCETMNGYDFLWRVLALYVPGFDPVVAIQTPQWNISEDIFHFAQSYLLYFRLQGKLQFHYTDRMRSGIFLRAIQHSDYADTVTTLQSHVNSYREEYDDGYLPPHLRLHSLAESIHQNAQSRLRDIVCPRLRRLNIGASAIQGPLTIQGLPDLPSLNRFGRQDRPGPSPRDRNRDDAGGNGRDRDKRDDGRSRDLRSNNRPRQQRGPTRPDRNRRPFLPDVQCDACKRVGHVAKHCDMLATAICLKCYMKNNLSDSTRHTIEQEWLKRWTDRLGNPDRTPRQVMRAYVKDLDITVAHLDGEMDWDCWDVDAFEDTNMADV